MTSQETSTSEAGHEDWVLECLQEQNRKCHKYIFNIDLVFKVRFSLYQYMQSN